MKTPHDSKSLGERSTGRSAREIAEEFIRTGSAYAVSPLTAEILAREVIRLGEENKTLAQQLHDKIIYYTAENAKLANENRRLQEENEKMFERQVEWATEHPTYKLSKELEAENFRLREVFSFKFEPSMFFQSEAIADIDRRHYMISAIQQDASDTANKILVEISRKALKGAKHS